MSVPRLNKPAFKKGPESGPNAPPRTNAWGRNSPGFNGPQMNRSPPPPAGVAQPILQMNGQMNGQGSFPPLGQGAPIHPTGGVKHSAVDTILQGFAPMMGVEVKLFTHSGIRYQGTITATEPKGGVTLSDVKDLLNPQAPPKPSVFVPMSDILGHSVVEIKANGSANTFRTDIDISASAPAAPKRDRDLEAWQPDLAIIPTNDNTTFGLSSGPGGGAWDQFAANESMFGVTTSFDENVYTTKLDRSKPDFRDRERQAQILADEIMGSNTSNPHLMEERNQKVDDSGLNEEDKYGAVARSPNAYVPPARRKNSSTGPTTNGPQVIGAPPVPIIAPVKQDPPPKVSINAPDGTPAKTEQGQAAVKGPDGVVDEFRQFVTTEKHRLTQKKQAIQKNEMDRRKADLLKFSQSFKLNKPIPTDLVSILAKDEEKQKSILEKSKEDAASGLARSIGPSITASNAGAKKSAVVAPTSPVVGTNGAAPAVPVKGSTPPSATQQQAAPTPVKPSTKKADGPPKSKVFLQAIPPFNPSKARGLPASTTTPALVNEAKKDDKEKEREAALASSASAASRLNINANSFKPNSIPTFKPSTSGSSSSSPKSIKPADQPAQPNPFFGTRAIKKSAPVHVKDEFNPFKHGKVPEASTISATWPYNGKRYMLLFGPLPVHQPPQITHAPPPPVGPPPTQTGFEEDPAAVAQRAGGYVFYSPYPYPGQPQHQMMPGMPPPPAGYMHAPYMQAIPYPPGMASPGGPPAMYAPPMGVMPPPGQGHFMSPPPGAYAPSPNGAGPRPSMSPAPVPTHGHPYPYHQSPQVQHALPYGMMMQHPGSNGPQHGYDGSQQPPPVSMGNHS